MGSRIKGVRRKYRGYTRIVTGMNEDSAGT